MDGNGTLTYANGDVYEGTWKAGGRERYGTIKWANGNIYEGNFKAELRDG